MGTKYVVWGKMPLGAGCNIKHMRPMYEVFDSQGNFMRRFPTYKQASNYKLAYGNSGWTIKF